MAHFVCTNVACPGRVEEDETMLGSSVEWDAETVIVREATYLDPPEYGIAPDADRCPDCDEYGEETD